MSTGSVRADAPSTPAAVDEATVPAPTGTWRLQLGQFSFLVSRKIATVSLVATAGCLILVVAAMGLGSTDHGYREVIEVLRGGGSRSVRLIVLEWRMPRILLGVTLGAALGVAGSIFQAVTRNPLGSPDLIGFTMGAQTGILVVVVLFGGGFVSVSLASLVGGLCVGSLIFVLSFRGGFGGLRLILAGIAISSLLGSFNRWLIVRADPDTAYGALKAVTGTLASADWKVGGPCSVAIVVVILVTLTRSRDLRALELGPDLARSLGAKPDRDRAVLVLLGTALVAFATMAAGPIGFVALLAPHIARILVRSSAAPLYLSGVVGAVMLLGADLVSQTMLESLPVGVVTSSVGGLYFMGLLVNEARTKRKWA
ncbi:Ferric enterobactin transport system permease protein FepG [Corynebacterium provencense]|uniref:Ferric enterobactin transport system permease protein FepG n=1 Tax=Corynebacterium provencense TaxID=1737425 RepID=A0A2Z3YT08_9CORY|nr:iron chelate uptake ABC transporter family permease subunit [Corynebacterium provencense]AWT27439.1 Ferric enterobactin transport system permease protein FepG [Corynebacterium provencense]